MIRTLVITFLGAIAARVAWFFADELFGLERAARSAARGVAM